MTSPSCPEAESDEAKRVAEAYWRVFGDLGEDRRIVVEQTCEMFTLAGECLCIDADKSGDEKEANRRIHTAGTLADVYWARFGILMERLGLDERGTLETVDRLSEWLDRRGWVALPSYRDGEGSVRRMAAYGMHEFMRRMRERCRECRRQIAEEAERRRREREGAGGR